jgi:hypothetical protein
LVKLMIIICRYIVLVLCIILKCSVCANSQSFSFSRNIGCYGQASCVYLGEYSGRFWAISAAHQASKSIFLDGKVYEVVDESWIYIKKKIESALVMHLWISTAIRLTTIMPDKLKGSPAWAAWHTCAANGSTA